MIPGLVWGRTDGSYGTSPGGTPSQPVVYCFAPGPAADAAGFHFSAGLPMSYQQLQQQQQLLMAAKTQQQTQQLYQMSPGALGLQASLIPYNHLPVVPQPAPVASGLSGLQMNGVQTPHVASMAYLPNEPVYIQTAPVNSTIGLSSGRKRGSDEMMSTVNGESTPSSIIDINNDAKKARLDSSVVARSSPVLHFRGVPNDVTDSEILQLTLPFGSVTNLVVSKKKNQALVEMADIVSAHAAVSFYSQRSPVLRGHVIQIQFSNREQLITDDSLQDAESCFDGTDGDEPRTVLRVVVENMLYAVTLDILKQLFSQYGQVTKIVTFTKNGMLHALIQFSDATSAQSAKLGLNGKCMYTGCNLLRVDFSKLPELSVRFNNDKTRDFTNPLLPSGDTAATMMDQRTLALAQQSQLSAAMLGGYGSVITYAPGTNPAAMMSAGTILLAAPTGSGLPACNVLLVSNLNEENVTPDALFTLFGVYGDVTRVKIMFNKKDTALVQFADAGQAHIAMTNLDKLKLWGKQVKVTPSKHNIVQMPKEGQPDAGLTKDYTNSPLHRFKKPNSKNYHNIFPPSATLHLSNIPGTSKERLMELFSNYGTIVGFKFFQKDCKMALLQMSSIEEAAEALIAMHNFQLAETSHLRVSFSKSSVTAQTVQDAQ